MLIKLQIAKLGFVATAALALAACETSGSYRIASVGAVPDASSASAANDGKDGSSGGTASSSGGGSSTSSANAGAAGALGGKIIVTAGNAVIGVAGKHNQLAGTVNGAVPQLTPVTGTVTRILTKTGQTLVNLGNGNTLILGKAGGRVGDILKIDLGSRTVIGAPQGSPLLGVGVLSPAGSANLVTVTTNRTNGAASSVAAPVTSVLPSVTNPQTDGTSAAGVVGGVVNNTTGAVGGVLGGLKPKK